MSAARFRTNFQAGTLTQSLLIGDTTMHSLELQAMPAIDGVSYYLPITIGTEVLWVMSHVGNASVATVLRGQENTLEQDHASVAIWQHGPTALDITEAALDSAVVHKSELVYNIKDYGAVADNATDCGPAITAACNAMPSNGGIVYIPASATQYFVNTSVVVSAGMNVQFIGGGRYSSRIRLGNGVKFLTISGSYSVAEAFFRIRDLEIIGNAAAGTSLLDTSGLVSFHEGLFEIANVMFRDFTGGTVCISIPNSVYFCRFSNCRFYNHSGGLKIGLASDFVVDQCEFGVPNSAPAIDVISGSSGTIRDSLFQYANGNGSSPDILIRTSANGSGGLLTIDGNKFAPEQTTEPSGRPRLQNFTTGHPNWLTPSVKVVNNNFYASNASPMAIDLQNPISGWNVDSNTFNGFSIICNDVQVPGATSANDSVWGDNIILVSNTSVSPSTTLFINGGRGFNNIRASSTSRVYSTDYLRASETRGLNNRLAWSETLTNWTRNGVAVATSTTDPFGGGKGWLLARSNASGSENYSIAIDKTAMLTATGSSAGANNARLWVKFWAKAGTLNTAIVSIFDVATGTAIASFMVQLAADWHPHTLLFNGLDSISTNGHGLNLVVYPGSFAQMSGNINMAFVQVSDLDSDYLPTSGTALSLPTTGSRDQLVHIAGGDTYFASGKPWFDVMAFGAKGDSATDDTASIQAAINAAATAASAAQPQVVMLPAGTYSVSGANPGGLVIPSYVTLQGPGSLLFANPAAGLDLVITKITAHTGAISSGSNSLSLNSASGVFVGMLATIRAGGSIDSLQTTTLNGGIDAVVTTVPCASLAHAPGGYYLVDSEVIFTNALVGNSLTSCTRGAAGTTAASHSNGATIAPLLVGRGIVDSVSGTTLTLRDALNPELAYSSPRTINTVEVDFGSIGSKIEVDIDGNKAAGLGTGKCIKLDRAVNARVKTTVKNAPYAALFCASAIACTADVVFHDCGNQVSHFGGAVWLWQGSYRNRIVVSGEQVGAHLGVVFDDRTTGGSEYDAHPIGNFVTGSITGPLNPGIESTGVLLSAGQGNSVSMSIRNFDNPVQFSSAIESVDGATSRGCANNIVSGSAFTGCQNAGKFDTATSTTGNILGPNASDITTVTNLGSAIANNNIFYGKTNQQFNVKDFGAKGDGATDDTAAMQIAINAATTNKLALYFPSGTYNINSTLTFIDTLKISGVGNESSIIQMTGSGATNQHAFSSSGATVASFIAEDLTIKMQTPLASYKTMKAINVDCGTTQSGVGKSVVVRRCHITGFNIGIYISGPNLNDNALDKITIENNNIQISTAAGNDVAECIDAHRCTQTFINNNTLDNQSVGDHTMYLIANKQLTVTNNTCLNAWATGVKITTDINATTTDFRQWNVENNSFKNCGAAVSANLVGNTQVLKLLKITNVELETATDPANYNCAINISCTGTNNILEEVIISGRMKTLQHAGIKYVTGTSSGSTIGQIFINDLYVSDFSRSGAAAFNCIADGGDANSIASLTIKGLVADCGVTGLAQGRAALGLSASTTRVQIIDAQELTPVVNSLASQTYTAPSVKVQGLTGASAASRYAGATTGGAPVSGTFAIGDYIVDQTGAMLVCITAGTPGTWQVVGNPKKTIKSITGSASATFTAIALVAAKRLKIFSVTLMTASTSAVTVTFKDGAGGTALQTYPMQALSGTEFGLSLGVMPDSYLFATSAGNLLEMAFSSANSVTYNISYFDDDAV